MKLLFKELVLAAHPTLFIFALLGALVIVPAYPYTVVFLFGCLAPYITCTYGRETNDIWYTAILPVTKRDIVSGRLLLTVCAQLCQLTVALVTALLRSVLGIPNNPVGIDPTVAWFGFGLMIYGLFDLVFFTSFYKTGVKTGKAFVLAAIPMAVLMIVAEGSVHLDTLAYLDSNAAQDLLRQLPVLLFGVACFALCLLLARRIAQRRFEQVDL